MKDPAYYRDLITRILQETPEDDLPQLPSRDEIEKRKKKHQIKMGRMPAWFEHIEGDPFKDEEFTWSISGSWTLPDGNTITSIFCGPLSLGEDGYMGSCVSATMANEYADEDHPYSDRMVEDEVSSILHNLGFPEEVGVQWSESGMQDADYLHFDSDLGEYIVNFMKDVK